jgi:hypothetical protein
MGKQLEHPDWVRRLNLFGPAVGHARYAASLDPDELLQTAQAATGLVDLGEGEWPGWEEAYRRLVSALDTEADLHFVGRVTTRAEILRNLTGWLRLVDHWKATPAISAESIDAPLFVVGPPRTGTTILLELLALDPQLRTPLAWEALHPLPRPDVGVTRLEMAECEQELWADVHPEFQTMHELRSDLPVECVTFLSFDFAGPYWSMMFDTPSHMGWSLEHVTDSLARVYRLHRRMLQTFQHGDEPRRWLLKSPGHLSTLPQLFAEYPDARVVFTHRDPRRFIASLVSLLAVLHFMRSDRVDVATLGPTMLATYQMFLEQAIDQRESGTIPDDQIVDSHFVDLMADPVTALRRIYDAFGMEWPRGHDGAVRGYLAEKPRAKFGAHAYTFSDVALDEDAVRAAFARYVAHYGIAEE